MSIVEKIAKFLLIGLVVLLASGFVASFFVDDQTVKRLGGPFGSFSVDTRNELTTVAKERTSSLVFWARTTFDDLTDFSADRKIPRVVMRIPPPPEDLGRSPPQENIVTAAPVEPERIEPAPAPALPDTTQEPEEAESNEVSAAESMSEPPVEVPPTPAVDALAASSVEETDPAPVPDAQPVETVEEAPIVAPELEAGPLPDTAEADELLAQLDGSADPDTDLAALDQGDALGASDGPPGAPDAIEDPNPGLSDYQEGLRFYNGEGVERNFGRAAQAFLRAAEAGHIGAQYNLGIMNYVGQTGGQDFANAAKWFEQAASQGHAQAQYNLGFLYYEGKGVQQDLETAFDWISRSADQGYEKAIRARDQFRQVMPDMFDRPSSS